MIWNFPILEQARVHQTFIPGQIIWTVSSPDMSAMDIMKVMTGSFPAAKVQSYPAHLPAFINRYL